MATRGLRCPVLPHSPLRVHYKHAGARASSDGRRRVLDGAACRIIIIIMRVRLPASEWSSPLVGQLATEQIFTGTRNGHLFEQMTSSIVVHGASARTCVYKYIPNAYFLANLKYIYIYKS